METHTRPERELDLTVNLTSGKCQVHHSPMARSFISCELDWIVDRHSRPTSWVQLLFVVLLWSHHVVGVPATQCPDSNSPSWSSSARVNGMG